jgi:hypothetical protein
VIDTGLLDDLLAASEPASFAERQVIGSALRMLRDGVDPADVLDFLETNRELAADWTALERDHGIAAVYQRFVREMQEWWTVGRCEPEVRSAWRRAHPVFAVYNPQRDKREAVSRPYDVPARSPTP